MAEQLSRHSGENINNNFEQETVPAAERHISPSETLRAKNEQAEHLEEARHHVKHEAKSSEQVSHELTAKTHSPKYEEVRVTRELKEMAYQRLLTRARRHMSPYSKMMSHVIHQPIINNVSEATAKTVGRPSGIIGGGIVALVGISIYYYITKHYGYNYNPFVFLLLIAVGFVLGWTVELSYKFLRALTKR